MQGFSCSLAFGIFLDQGSNSCLLHWPMDSYPLNFQERPCGSISMGPLGTSIKIYFWSQDGGIRGHGIQLSSQIHQEYIYKWNKSHRVPAEYYWRTLDTCRTRKIPTRPGRTTERKTKRGNEKGPAPLREAKGEERFLHSEKSPHSGKISWDREGALGDQRGRQQLVSGRQDRVRSALTVHAAAPCTPA